MRVGADDENGSLVRVFFFLIFTLLTTFLTVNQMPPSLPLGPFLPNKHEGLETRQNVSQGPLLPSFLSDDKTRESGVGTRFDAS